MENRSALRHEARPEGPHLLPDGRALRRPGHTCHAGRSTALTQKSAQRGKRVHGIGGSAGGRGRGGESETFLFGFMVGIYADIGEELGKYFRGRLDSPANVGYVGMVEI